MPTTFRYDVFISYASEDRPWVVANIYEPLKRCRTAEGNVPRIFLDCAASGIKLGDNWQDALAQSIGESRKFVPIYSRNYFNHKKPCNWEMNKASEMDLDRSDRKINPILLDVSASSEVPGTYSDINYVPVDKPDWFARLCNALDLVQAKEILELRFRTRLPESVVVNNTLPAIEVEVLAGGQLSATNVEIHLSSRRGGPRGELSVFARNGVAEFNDLSFAEATDKPITLLASGDGCVSDSSSAFRVVPLKTSPIPRGTSIEAGGDPVFFADGQALLVIGQERMAVYDGEGKPVGRPTRVFAPVRCLARDGDRIAVADWAGRVRIIGRDGQMSEHDFGTRSESMHIPGALALTGGDAYVGFWNGNIYRLAAGQPPERICTHLGGVQSFTVIGEHIVIVDLDGKLLVMPPNGNASFVGAVERCCFGMKRAGESAVFVGEKHLFKVHPGTGVILKEPLRIGPVRAALVDVERAVVCDTFGRGFRFDAGLTPESRFQVPAGAVPSSADHSGTWAVFRQSDGAHVLLYRHQVVYTHAAQLAVSPEGESFAIGEGGSLRLVEPSAICALTQENKDG